MLIGCSKAASEPEGVASPAGSAAPAVAPLGYDVPGTWTTLPPARTGPLKASYKVPKAGNDKADAEVQVFFFGTGSLGDPDKSFADWSEQFEADGGVTAARKPLAAPGLKFPVETIEAAGTYKQGIGPQQRGRKRSPIEMVKEGYRLYGAVVKTPDRGNWFFRMTGPDETVQAGKSAFEAMIASSR